MANFAQRVEELIAKHPHLTKEEIIKIVTEKNERKKAKKAARNNSQKRHNQEDAPDHE
ncbi:hypothetical protein L0668_05045 [Paraglaciecola aquimarina]|uniref:Uncharacterized protein n=1 Tax=Paraglaciecola algarum TaxID=3050085 RepID=A0ABS9D3G7_9ALTE|nr:hypothetical protein [Paraglaciecola sp. G1-23]MCF2947465.1 hypothetical protein [Paraglaciecola sp. G1-23]